LTVFLLAAILVPATTLALVTLVVSSSRSAVLGSIVVSSSRSGVIGCIATVEGIRTTGTTDAEINAVIKGTVLRDSDESGRVIRVCVHGAQTVGTRPKTVGNGFGYDAVDSSTVDTLEKREDGGVQGRG